MMDNQKPKSKKEITLDDKVVEMLGKSNEQLKLLQNEVNPIIERMNMLRDKMNSMVMAICFQNGVNSEKEGIYFSDDSKTIFVYDLPTTEGKKSPTKTKSKS